MCQKLNIKEVREPSLQVSSPELTKSSTPAPDWGRPTRRQAAGHEDPWGARHTLS